MRIFVFLAMMCAAVPAGAQADSCERAARLTLEIRAREGELRAKLAELAECKKAHGLEACGALVEECEGMLADIQALNEERKAEAAVCAAARKARGR